MDERRTHGPSLDWSGLDVFSPRAQRFGICESPIHYWKGLHKVCYRFFYGLHLETLQGSKSIVEILIY
jgi:hypothetical protein